MYLVTNYQGLFSRAEKTVYQRVPYNNLSQVLWEVTEFVCIGFLDYHRIRFLWHIPVDFFIDW